MDAAVDAVIITDAFGTVEFFSKAAENMFLYKANEMLGQHINILVPSKYKQANCNFDARNLLIGDAKITGRSKKTEGMKSDGTVFPIKLSIGEVSDGGTTQLIGIVHDLTEQEKYRLDAEKIREKLAHIARLNAIGELVAEVAHEMNQPITAIRCYAQACINLASRYSIESTSIESTSTKSTSIKNWAEIIDIQGKIETQSNRAIAINQRLRQFVKIRGGQRESININDIITESIELVKIDPRHINHPIKKRLESLDGAYVFVDPVQIQQVILNLVRNAMDAMEDLPGGILISGEWLDNTNMKISVSDQGCGLKDDVIESMFSPFVSTKPDGMGMGLSVSQTIVHGYGGNIIFEKNKVKGTTFSFTLPTLDADKHKTQSRIANAVDDA